jgi:hypothetical protein
MIINNYEDEARQLWSNYFIDESNELFWKKYEALVEASKHEKQLPSPIAASATAAVIHGSLAIPSELMVPESLAYEQQLTKKYQLNKVLIGGLFVLIWVLAVRYRFVGHLLFLFLNILGAFFSITYLSEQPNRIRKLTNTVIHINQKRLLCNGKGVNVSSIPLDHIRNIIPFSWGFRVFSEDGTSMDVPKGLMNYDDLQSYLMQVTHLRG